MRRELKVSIDDDHLIISSVIIQPGNGVFYSCEKKMKWRINVGFDCAVKLTSGDDYQPRCSDPDARSFRATSCGLYPLLSPLLPSDRATFQPIKPGR